MKKMISFLLIMMLLLFTVGCNSEPPSKLAELKKYSAMIMDGTTSIEVTYDYIEREFSTYEFIIEDQETIEKIMSEIFNIELKDYPKSKDIDFYQRWITVKQGDSEYYIHLGYTSDENGNKYLCQSQKVCEIIEQYIEENLIQ